MGLGPYAAFYAARFPSPSLREHEPLAANGHGERQDESFRYLAPPVDRSRSAVKDDLVYLRHIDEAINRILAFTSAGESAKKVSAGTRVAHPDIP